MFTLTANSAVIANANASAGQRLRAFVGVWGMHRPQRVAGLLAAVLALSAFDVAVTVHQISSSGMFENNPLARLVVAAAGDPTSLVALKAMSLLVSMGLLLGLRRHWQAELGAWLAVGILVWLTAQWGMYLHVMKDIETDALAGLSLSEGFVSVE